MSVQAVGAIISCKDIRDPFLNEGYSLRQTDKLVDPCHVHLNYPKWRIKDGLDELINIWSDRHNQLKHSTQFRFTRLLDERFKRQIIIDAWPTAKNVKRL